MWEEVGENKWKNSSIQTPLEGGVWIAELQNDVVCAYPSNEPENKAYMKHNEETFKALSRVLSEKVFVL